MTLYLVPDDRPAPRPANLGARESDRTAAWRKRIVQAVIDDDPEPVSMVDRFSCWYENLTPRMAWTLIGLIAVCIGCAWLIVEIGR